MIFPRSAKMPRSKETYTRIPWRNYGKIPFFEAELWENLVFEAELWEIIVFWWRNYNNLCKCGGIITTYQLLLLAELWEPKVAELWELPLNIPFVAAAPGKIPSPNCTVGRRFCAFYYPLLKNGSEIKIRKYFSPS
jgi:hypothetical protein